MKPSLDLDAALREHFHAASWPPAGKSELQAVLAPIIALPQPRRRVRRSRLPGTPAVARPRPTRLRGSPPWSTRPFLTTARLVAVITIVAFGGGGALLLSAGLGPSPTPSVDASPRTTPTSTRDPVHLSGLVTEPVEPGVVRVVSDGIRAISPAGDGEYREIATGPDGSVWLGIVGPKGRSLVRLGDPAAYPVEGLQTRSDVPSLDLQVAPDGSPWAHTSALAHLGDQGWAVVRTSPSGEADAREAYDIAPDGSVWVTNGATLGRLTSTGWREHSIDVDLAAALGVAPDAIAGYPAAEHLRTGHRVTGLQAASDGSVLIGLGIPVHDRASGSASIGHVLLRFEGDSWSVLDPLGTGSYAEIPAFDIGADGTAWVLLGQVSNGIILQGQLARLSGGEWSRYSSADGVRENGVHGEVPALLAVAPDGTAWMRNGGYDCGGVRSFDGATWQDHLTGHCLDEIAVAADGTVWVIDTPDRGVEIDGAVRAGDTFRIDPSLARSAPDASP